jgi:EmrB/QacA subfamily drug resistance transporter
MSLGYRPPCDEGVIRASPADAPCSFQAKPWVLAATILGSSLAFIDSSSTNVALPALQADLGATVVEIQWVVNGYTLMLASLILLGGSLGDHFGRTRVFMLGVAIFMAASLLCALAPTTGGLIAARIVQGLGGALLIPGSLAIISASFPEDERGGAIGLWSGFSALAAAAGPVLGGWLIDTFSWRWIFFTNIPVALVILAISFWRVPESRDEEARGLDWLGALLATLGLGGLTYGLLESSERSLADPLVLASLLLGGLALAAFVVVEARRASPMVPLRLFRSRAFSGANLLTLGLYAALGGALFFVPLNLIQVQGYSATGAGAALAPFVMILFVLSRWAGGLVSRFGARLPLVVGPSVAALGFALFALPGVGGSYWLTFFPPALVLGLGMAVSVAPLTTTVMSAVADQYAGTASGINNAVSRVASLFAIAVMGIVMLLVFSAALDARLSDLGLAPETHMALEAERIHLASMQLPQDLGEAQREGVEQAIAAAFVRGFRIVMIIAAALALASAITAWFMIDPPGLARAPTTRRP